MPCDKKTIHRCWQWENLVERDTKPLRFYKDPLFSVPHPKSCTTLVEHFQTCFSRISREAFAIFLGHPSLLQSDYTCACTHSRVLTSTLIPRCMLKPMKKIKMHLLNENAVFCFFYVADPRSTSPQTRSACLAHLPPIPGYKCLSRVAPSDCWEEWLGQSI
jgi:hypothetical protein